MQKQSLIAPSILNLNPIYLEDFICDVYDMGVRVIHLDIMDGQFVPPISFGSEFVKYLSKKNELLYEAHLMTYTPERHFEAFIASGCKRIIFHVEATQHIHRHVQFLKGKGIEVGLALNPGTSTEQIECMLDEIDMVTVMTVNPGWGGQSLIPSTIKKIEYIRKHYPDITIEVDGGVAPENIKDLYLAGANLFVVGSYLANHYPHLEEPMMHLISKLEDLC